MKKIALLCLFLSLSSVMKAQTTFSSIELTNPYDQIKFNIPNENRYWFMSKPSIGRSYALYSPDDGGYFTYWKTSTGDMIIERGKLGIGTSSPTAGLEVRHVDGIKIESDIGWKSSIKMTDAWANTATKDDMLFSTAGGFMFKMDDNSNGVSTIQGFNVYNRNNISLFSIKESNGNIAIGTDTSNSKLTINGKITGDSTNEVLTLTNNYGSVNDAVSMRFNAGGGTSGTFLKHMRQGSAGGDFAIFTSPTLTGTSLERMRISKDGKIGLGTSTPEHRLSVIGTLSVGSSQSNDDGWGEFVIKKVASGINYASLGFTQGSSTGTGNREAAIAIQRLGNVGFGTTTPETKLHVQDSYILSDGSGPSHGFRLKRDNFDTYEIRHIDGGLGIYNATDNQKEISLVGNGNVGIGTTSPGARLELFKENTTSRTSVQDLLRLGTTHASIGYDGFGTGIVDYRRTYQNPTPHAVNRISFIEKGNSFNDFGGAILFSTKQLSSGSAAPVERMRVNYDGNVGIGTTNPTARLTIQGPSSAYPNNKALYIRADGESANYKDQVSIYSESNTGYGIAFAGQGHHRGGIYALSSGGSATSQVDMGIWARNGGSIFLEASKVGVGTTAPQAKLNIPAPYPTTSIGWSDLSKSGLLVGTTSVGIGIDANEIVSKGGHMYIGTISSGSDIYFRAGATSTRMLVDGASGNVGIGTETPNRKLEVNGDIAMGSTTQAYKSLLFKPVTPTGSYNGTLEIESNTTPGNGVASFLTHFKTSDNGSGGQTRHDVVFDGRVGIGTTIPTADLHINGAFSVGSGLAYGNLIVATESTVAGYNGTVRLHSNSIPGTGTAKFLTHFKTMEHASGSGGVAIHDVAFDGSVGVGTTSLPSGYKLAVAGKVITEEVKVKLQSSGWPDYVFASDYKLPTLKEVEKHIQEKGYLPSIPSAEEVEKNGIFVGEMNAKLLQKIEELTLYAIDQEKVLNKQENRIEKLEAENKQLKVLLERVAKLERQVNKKK